ncbi:MAG TPA: hypothetical protein VMD59_14645, partial [Acidimicrobiales bacterium]|nr:hypothetical protein [Acidimicrobiales bacterium]
RGERLTELMAAITELDDLLGEFAGRDEVHMDGAEEKIIARVHGARMPLRLLPPYSGAEESGFEQYAAKVRQILDRLGLDRRPGEGNGATGTPVATGTGQAAATDR